LKAFHAAVPNHEVITVVLDIKSAFKPGQDPAALDQLLIDTFGSGALVRPGDLLTGCSGASSLRDAVAGSCLWPQLSAWRGRLLFVVTGGDGCDSASHVNSYAGTAAEAVQRAAFIAPNVHVGCAWSSYQSGHDHVVFFNMAAIDANRALEIQQAGLVARVWGLNSASSWSVAFNKRAHLLGTDKVNMHQDPWTITHTSEGWPFDCLSGCTTPTRELAQLMSIDVTSDDIWQKKDSFYFLQRDVSNDSGEKIGWRAYLATPNSHVEPWAKACLMARRSNDEAAANFAVCRPADANRIRVQLRPSDGANTQAFDVVINPADTIDDPGAAFVQLEMDAGGKTFRGFASQDGVEWILVKQYTFDQPLLLHGVAASSHGSKPVRFVVGNLRQRLGQMAYKQRLVSELSAVAIGASATGSASDGL